MVFYSEINENIKKPIQQKTYSLVSLKSIKQFFCNTAKNPNQLTDNLFVRSNNQQQFFHNKP